jgi:hypothetical protein
MHWPPLCFLIEFPLLYSVKVIAGLNEAVFLISESRRYRLH